LVVLRHSEQPEDQEKGFVGNTILLTQPRPVEIKQKLLPTPLLQRVGHQRACFQDTLTCSRKRKTPRIFELQKSCENWDGMQQDDEISGASDYGTLA